MTSTIQNDKKQNNISNDNKKGKSNNNKKIANKSFHLITILFLHHNHFLVPPSVSELRRRLIRTPLNRNRDPIVSLVGIATRKDCVKSSGFLSNFLTNLLAMKKWEAPESTRMQAIVLTIKIWPVTTVEGPAATPPSVIAKTRALDLAWFSPWFPWFRA